MTGTPQLDFFGDLPVAKSLHPSVRASIEQAHGFHCDGADCGGWVEVHGRWNGVKLCGGCRGDAPMWNPQSYAVRSRTGEVLASCGDHLDAFHIAVALRPGVPDYDCVTCESTSPDATKQTFLPDFVSWHGIACAPASGYSWQCTLAFVVGIFLLRGKPHFNARSAYRDAPRP
ncbi:MAG: hypothetical protein Q8L14_22030 [Myxococcales bacterium]|nr:hypothetical protein [Myxococcales bacterium]